MDYSRWGGGWRQKERDWEGERESERAREIERACPHIREIESESGGVWRGVGGTFCIFYFPE